MYVVDPASAALVLFRLELFFLIGMVVMGFIERRWLYAESDVDTSNSEQASSRKV